MWQGIGFGVAILVAYVTWACLKLASDTDDMIEVEENEDGSKCFFE